jgi:hypothetical protein
LTNDTDCLKANLVLLVAVPENFFQTIEILQPAIKSLMACSSPTKKLLQGSAMLWIGSGYSGICIGPVTNSSSVWRDLLLEFFFENCQVMIGSWKRASDPNNSIFKDRNSNFIIQASFLGFVGVVWWVLDIERMIGFQNSAMVPSTVQRKTGRSRVFITPIFWPNYLLRLESCNLLQIVPAPMPDCFFILMKGTHHPFFSGIAESIVHCHEEIILIPKSLGIDASFWNCCCLEIFPNDRQDKRLGTIVSFESPEPHFFDPPS